MPAKKARDAEQAALAAAFCLTDIFEINAAMQTAPKPAQAAWQRVRAKLIEAAGLKPPALRIPSELLDENGRIIPGKVADPNRKSTHIKGHAGSKCPECE
jgi:hypothetical protein